MKNLNLFIYLEAVTSIKEPTIGVASVSFVHEKKTYAYANASVDNGPVDMLGELLEKANEDLVNIESENITIILDSKEDLKLEKSFDIINLDDGENKLKSGLAKGGITNIGGRIRVTNAIVSLSKLPEDKKRNIIFGADLEPEIFSGMLHCEAFGTRAHTRLVKGIGEDEPLIVVDTPAGTGKTSKLPNLLMDKLMFDIGLSTNVLNDGMCYFTGNGAIEGNKPKKMTVAAKKAANGYMYYTGSNDKLRVLGRAGAEDRYNVLLLKDKSDYLDNLMSYQRVINDSIYKTKQFVVYSMANLSNAKLNKELTKGDFSILKNTNNGDLYTLTLPRRDLSYVMNPPRLAFKLRRTLENNLNVLTSLVTDTYNKEIYTYTDVTEYLFDNENNELVDGVDKLTKKLVLKDIKIPNGKSVTIKPLLKFDLPDYLKLRKLRADNPKLKIVTWMVDEHTVAYSFVITTDEGHLYYSSEYGSRHLLPTVRKSKRK